MEQEEDPQAKMKEMAKVRGYASEWWEIVLKMDPELVETYNRLAALALLHEGAPTEGKALPAKYRELVAIAILAFRGNEGGVENHMRRALRMGATKEEVFEAVEAMFPPGGTPTVSLGMRALTRILKEQGQM